MSIIGGGLVSGAHYQDWKLPAIEGVGVSSAGKNEIE